MTPDQEIYALRSLNQIAYSLELITRYAELVCTHFNLPQVTLPDPLHYPQPD